MARVLILAHHDRHGVVDDHVVAAIHAYRAVADYLVVVSTSARALPDTVAPLVDRFIPRPNEGYDFCSWRAGIGALGEAGACDELICVNDSVYGPLADLGSTLGNSRRCGGVNRINGLAISSSSQISSPFQYLFLESIGLLGVGASQRASGGPPLGSQLIN